MKKLLLILLLSYNLSPIAYCQDVQRFAERQIAGTARYVGMGGAMTAVGGDPSAVLDNPAGLGLYRRSELAITLDETIDYTTQHNATTTKNPSITSQRTRLGIPHTSTIWSIGNPNKQRGIIFNNLMFSINRLANFNRNIIARGENLGLVETIYQKTTGVPERDLATDEASRYDPWSNHNVAWLSVLGYATYLIDPDTSTLGGSNKWTPAVNFTKGTLSISESGSADQYTFAWAGNINNQWYIGLSLNIPTLSYTKQTSLCETNRIHSAELKSLFHLSGVGIGGSIGLIYRPMQHLRIGASFQAPTMIMLSEQTEGDMYTTINGGNYECLTPASGSIKSEMISPLRTSVSVAGQIGNIGLVSLQYDYAHSAEIHDVHTVRIGAETQVYTGIFLNAGYIYESTFLKKEASAPLLDNIRTDTDSRFDVNTQYASVGLGYRNNIIAAHIAYQYRWQMLHQFATESQQTPMDILTKTHRIVATLAWRF